MNLAKKRVIEIIEQLPDNVDTEYEILDQAFVLARLEKSRASIAANGGTSHAALKVYMDEQRRKLVEGRE